MASEEKQPRKRSRRTSAVLTGVPVCAALGAAAGGYHGAVFVAAVREAGSDSVSFLLGPGYEGAVATGAAVGAAVGVTLILGAIFVPSSWTRSFAVALVGMASLVFAPLAVLPLLTSVPEWFWGAYPVVAIVGAILGGVLESQLDALIRPPAPDEKLPQDWSGE